MPRTQRTLSLYMSYSGTAPLYQKRERGAELCVWLEDFLEKLLCNPWITLYQIYEEGANFAFP